MAQPEKTLQTRMRRYLRRFVATTRRLRPPLFLVPTLTVIVGVAVSGYVYTFIRHQERDALNQESSLRAREMINQIDLLISNSLLRIQSYEEYMGPRELRSLNEALFYKQALQYTIFSRLAIFQKVKSPGKKPPTLRRLHLVDSVADNLPVSPSEIAASDELTATLQQMITQNFYQRAVIFNFGKVPVISVILNSKFSKNFFFVYSTPLDRMFETVNLRPDEQIKLSDPATGLAWIVTMTDEKLPNGKSVATVAAAKPVAPVPSGLNAYPVKFDQGLPQSGLQVNFEFRFAGADSSFAASLIIGLFTLLLTFVVAYLFWILISQNRMVSRLVVEKTHDLEKAHHDVQDALQTKTRFIGNISHEIRTPLNLILGMIDLCQERGGTDTKLQDYLRSMKSSGNHLLEMIEDLLDLAKSESNEIHMQDKTFALTPFLEELGRFATQECAKKNLAMHLDLPADLPTHVKCDPSRLRQILLNLLKNACKYTNEGYVRLRVTTHEGTVPDRRRLVFEIEDSGIGIPKDKAAKIFDAFFQVESGRILSEGGVGLGLSIVKELVRRMNGSVDVRSNAGRGSVFRVELELETPEVAAVKKSRRDGTGAPEGSGKERVKEVVGQNLSILAADDDDGNRELLRAYFEGTSWRVDYAVNGQDAWERYLNHKSDVLILDVRMPVLDGFSVVEKIRAHEKATNAQPTPIILVTADALSQTADRAKGYEALSYLTKPVRKSKLFETIAQTREL